MVFASQPRTDAPPPEFLDGDNVFGKASFWVEAEAVTGADADRMAEAVKALGTDRSGAPTIAYDMPIRGVATTDHKDMQGETARQDGVDWSYFREWGWFNDIHDKSAGSGLGEPTAVYPVDLPDGHKGWVVEGFLYDTPAARKVWDILVALKKNPLAKRRIGFSIQGPILLRLDESGHPAKDGKTLARILVMDVSITRHPVNKHAPLEAALKSLDWAVKSLEAGHPTPTYSGGGSGSPLLTQSHDARPVRRIIGRKTMDKAEFARRFGKCDPETQQLAAKAHGVEWTQADADGYGHGEPDGDEATKSLDERGVELYANAEELAKDVSAHVREGGMIKMFWPGQERTGDEAVKAFEVLSGGVGALGERTEKVMEHQGALFDQLKELISIEIEARKSLDERLDGIAGQLSALGARPVQRKTIVPGAPIERPADQAAADEPLPYGTARKSLEAAIENAVAAGEPQARIDQLSNARAQMDAGRRFLPADFAALKVNAIQ